MRRCNLGTGAPDPCLQSQAKTDRGLSEPLEVHDVAVLRCCVAPSLAVRRGGADDGLSFRFSGLRITVQDQPCWYSSLLSELRYTPIDAGVRGCMTRNETGQTLGVRLPVVTVLYHC